MRLLADENVPTSTVEFFRDRGHEVILLADVLVRGTEDPAVARRASELGAIVITWNRRHFQALMARHTKRGVPSYPGMGLLAMSCSTAEAEARLRESIDLIEFEYQQIRARPGARLNIELQSKAIRILR